MDRWVGWEHHLKEFTKKGIGGRKPKLANKKTHKCI
jgi:hypothetical protein